MATKNQNFFKVEGIIYAKPSRKITSKKDGKEYEFKSIILELKREHKGKIFVDLPEFQLGFGVVDDGFDIGDYVQISFSLVGKEVSASFHKTELKALYINHPALSNDTRDIGGDPFPKKAKVAEPSLELNTEEDDDLPF